MMGKDDPWPSLAKAIRYVAFESDARREWLRAALTKPDYSAAFATPIHAEVANEIVAEIGGASLYSRAARAIQDAAARGKLRCRGTKVGASPADIDAAVWNDVVISIPDGAVTYTANFRTAFGSVYVDGSQLRRLWPRSSGRAGVRAAEIECEHWIAKMPPSPMQRKAVIRAQAQRTWGDRLSNDGFDRAWSKSAPKEWRRPGRRQKIEPV